MSGDERWCLIESDPGVFTNMIKGFGARDVQVEEIYSLDKEHWKQLLPIYGLIFLCKYRECQEEVNPTDQKLFFARQVVTNACATYALLNILMNIDHSNVELGTTLVEIKQFCKNLDGYCSGEVIANTPLIRLVHNASAQETMLEFQKFERQPSDGGAFHYVGYVPVNGKIYELDGLKPAPNCVGTVDKDKDWTELVAAVINAKFDGSIRYNLMAVVPDRIQNLGMQLDELWCLRKNTDINRKISDLERLILEEMEKRLRYEEEYVRRRHDHFPIVMEVLKILGRDGKLVDLYNKAKKLCGQNKK